MGAPRTYRPVEFDAAPARRAGRGEIGPAGRAPKPRVVDRPRARAASCVVHGGREDVRLEVACGALGDRLGRPHHAVGDHAQWEQERRQGDDAAGGDVRADEILRASTRVTEHPERARQPQDPEIADDQPRADLDGRRAEHLADDVAEDLADVLHRSAPRAGAATTRPSLMTSTRRGRGCELGARGRVGHQASRVWDRISHEFIERAMSGASRRLPNWMTAG